MAYFIQGKLVATCRPVYRIQAMRAVPFFFGVGGGHSGNATIAVVPFRSGPENFGEAAPDVHR